VEILHQEVYLNLSQKESQSLIDRSKKLQFYGCRSQITLPFDG
jgi:hypothetical protein